MKKPVRIIGYIVIAILEAMIIYQYITIPAERAACISSQLIVFGAVWGAVFGKNIINMKRDTNQMNGSS